MKLRNLFVLAIVSLLTSSFRSDTIDTEGMSYPKPEGINNLLFYIQRTINANTIVYVLNEDEDGNLDELNPIKVYWIKYAEKGKIDPLSYVQQNYAYGVKSQIVNKEKHTFMFEFVSYSKKTFYLMRSQLDNKYHVYASINNKMAIVNNIQVKIEGGTFWVPNVKYVEVKAFDQTTNTEVTEIIKP